MEIWEIWGNQGNLVKSMDIWKIWRNIEKPVEIWKNLGKSRKSVDIWKACGNLGDCGKTCGKFLEIWRIWEWVYSGKNLGNLWKSGKSGESGEICKNL